jgi:hypothetical protein
MNLILLIISLCPFGVRFNLTYIFQNLIATDDFLQKFIWGVSINNGYGGRGITFPYDTIKV